MGMKGAPPKSSMAASFTGDGYGFEGPGRRYRACTPPDPETAPLLPGAGAFEPHGGRWLMLAPTTPAAAVPNRQAQIPNSAVLTTAISLTQRRDLRFFRRLALSRRARPLGLRLRQR